MSTFQVNVRSLIFLFLTILIISEANSQDHLRLISEGETDFNVIREAFYSYWDRTGRRNSDYKKFKRWENHVLPRLNNGHLPSNADLAKRISSFQIMKEKRPASARTQAQSWEAIGPFSWQVASGGYSPGNGRVNCITVDPDDPDVIYIGAASGGIWKSSDGGTTWATSTDGLAVLGITDIYVNPANTSEVVALTGDAYGSDTPSIGLIKSADGGSSWSTTNLTFEESDYDIFFKLEVSPTDSDVMLVAGDGVHRSTDGGDTWTQVMTVSVSDLLFHPTDGDVVYAARRYEDNENEVTIYKSTDGGANWSSSVFTFGTLGKTLSRKALSVTPDNVDVLYILASSDDATFGGLFKTSDKLSSLSLMSSAPNIFGYEDDGSDEDGQGWYDLALVADPDDETVIYASGVHIWKSEDSGLTWTVQNNWLWENGTYPYVHADVHTLDFYNGKLYAGCDGGIFMTADGGTSFTDLSSGLNIGQFYRIGTHPTDENIIVGGLQDNGAYLRKNSQWFQIYGADGMEAIIDHTDPTIVYSSLQNGSINRYSSSGDVIDEYLEIPGEESGGWITPYIMHPTDNKTLYFGFENVWKSTDQGSNYTQISNFQSGGNIEFLKQHPSSTDHILTYVDGTLYLTTDEGDNWSDISVGLPFYTLTDVEFDYSDPSIIWATFSNYNTDEKVYKSTNSGSSWTSVSEGLPEVPVNCILSQNSCSGKMYVGTDIGVYTRNEGQDTWNYMGEGLPNVIVRELDMQYETGMLFAATYGRGGWKIPAAEMENQTISFETIAHKFVSSEPFELVAISDAGLDVTFTSSDPDVVAIDGTTATVKSEGSVTITASQEGNCDYLPDEASQELNITVLSVNPGSNDIVIYPNPVRDSKALSIMAPANLQETEVSVFNMDGKRVIQKRLYKVDDRFVLPIENLKSGLYVLKMEGVSIEFVKS